MHDNLRIAYVTLAFNPQLYYRKMFNGVLYQDYPHDLKTWILLHQRSKITNRFPSPIVHDMPFQIIERNVECSGNEWWARKMWAAADVIEVLGNIDIVILIDEDDEFPPSYTRHCLSYLDGDADATWDYYNIDVMRSKVVGYKIPTIYNSAIGTAAWKTDAFINTFRELKKQYPHGTRKEGKGGALDARYKMMAAEMINIENREFEPENLRGYFRQKYANTTKRDPSEDIDFDFDYGIIPKKRPDAKRTKLEQGKIRPGRQTRRKKI